MFLSGRSSWFFHLDTNLLSPSLAPLTLLYTHLLNIVWTFSSSVVACGDCLRWDMAGEAQPGDFSCWQGSLLCRVLDWHCSPSGTMEQPGIKAGLSRAASAQQGVGIQEGCLHKSQGPGKSFIYAKSNPFYTDSWQLVMMSNLKLISKLLLGTIVRLSFRKLSKQALNFKQVPKSHWTQ